MKYATVRAMAQDIKAKIDSYISKDLSADELYAFINDLMSIAENRKRVYKVKGYAVTITTVLGARMTIFDNILKEIDAKRNG